MKRETIYSLLLRLLCLAYCVPGLFRESSAHPTGFRLEFVGSELLGYYGDNLGMLQRMDTLLKYMGGGAGLDSVVLESGYAAEAGASYLKAEMGERRLAQMRAYLQRRCEHYGYAPVVLREHLVRFPLSDTDPRDITAVTMTFFEKKNRFGNTAAEESATVPFRIPDGKTVRHPGAKSPSLSLRAGKKVPVLAVKTDLVLWGGVSPGFEVTTFMPNLALEVYAGRRWSVELSALYTHCKNLRGNGLQILDAYRIEPRYWFGNDRLFRGFYAGISVGYGSFDHQPVADVPADNTGYTGTFLNAGLTAGYALALSPHWLFEGEVAGGYRMEKTRSYRIEKGCSYYESDISRNRLVPGVRLNLIYRICRYGREK